LPVAKPSREMDKLWIRVSDILALLDRWLRFSNRFWAD
jgi:hypothetical protein